MTIKESIHPSIHASIHPIRKEWFNGCRSHRITEMATIPRMGKGGSQFQGLDRCSLCETEPEAGHSLSMINTKGILSTDTRQRFISKLLKGESKHWLKEPI